MKTKHLWSVLVLICTLQATAQIPQAEIEIFATDIVTTAEKNLAVKPIVMGRLGSCDPLSYINEFDLKKLVPEKKPFVDFIKKLDLSHNNSLMGLQIKIPLGKNETLQDKAIESLARSKSVGAFIKDITGLEIYELEEKDLQLLMDYYLNHPIKKNIGAIANGKKFVKAKFSPCFATASSELKLSNWKKYPNVTWALITTITIVCDCEELGPGDLNQGTIEFEAEIKGMLSSKTIKHLNAKLFPPSSGKRTCCGLEDPDEDETDESTGPGEEYTPPQQTFGVSGGIGLDQDFEETSICIGAEYLFNVTTLGNNPLFIGANAQFSTTSFMDFNNSWVSIGPTVQLFSPISANGDTQMTNGINGNYIFGTNENGGSKVDVNGFEISINTGLNVQISNNVSLSLIIPIVTHQNLTFESQEGGSSIDISNTSLLLNKNNPVKLGVRIGLDK